MAGGSGTGMRGSDFGCKCTPPAKAPSQAPSLDGRRGAAADAAVWHLVHDDGDEEDLDEPQMRRRLGMKVGIEEATATADVGVTVRYIADALHYIADALRKV